MACRWIALVLLLILASCGTGEEWVHSYIIDGEQVENSIRIHDGRITMAFYVLQDTGAWIPETRFYEVVEMRQHSKISQLRLYLLRDSRSGQGFLLSSYLEDRGVRRFDTRTRLTSSDALSVSEYRSRIDGNCIAGADTVPCADMAMMSALQGERFELHGQ